MKIMSGLNDWNHEAGISQPKIIRSVLASAQSAIVLPCCSYTLQKTMERAIMTKIAPIFSQSSRVIGSGETGPPDSLFCMMRSGARCF